MKRRSFLKGIPLIGAFLSDSAKAAGVKNDIKFSDLFYNTELPNENLFFLKESQFKADLVQRLSKSNLLKTQTEKFDLPYYTGCHGVVLPIKDSYTGIEIAGFADQCFNAFSKYSYCLERHRQHFIMLFRDQKYQHLRLEVFAVFKPVK